MELSDEQVAKFRAICMKQFGRELSKHEAYEGGIKLVRLMTIIYKPITKQDVEAVQKRQNDLRKKLKGL